MPFLDLIPVAPFRGLAVHLDGHLLPLPALLAGHAPGVPGLQPRSRSKSMGKTWKNPSKSLVFGPFSRQNAPKMDGKRRAAALSGRVLGLVAPPHELQLLPHLAFRDAGARPEGHEDAADALPGLMTSQKR